MSFDNLTEDNVMLYAIKAYDKPNCIMSEFSEDMKRFNYLKRLFRRYRKHNEMRERLVLNHLVVLNNVFGVEVTTRLLFYEMSPNDYPQLKTYLLFLSCMPDVIVGIKGKNILSPSIEVDMEIANVLRTLK
jgi:adenylate kinase family enzyme